MSVCGCSQGVGCSNSAVDNFDLDFTEENVGIFNVFQNYIVRSYETLIHIIIMNSNF